MAFSIYEEIYNNLTEKLNEIKDEKSYNNISKAFAFWYLSNGNVLSEEECEECIIDGKGDNGIDAYMYDENSRKLDIFQFKYPEKKNNYTKEIDKKDINSTLRGFKVLMGKVKPETPTNERITQAIYDLKQRTVSNCTIHFISYNKGIIAHKDLLDEFTNDFYEQTGTNVEFEIVDVKEIKKIFEKINRDLNIDIVIECEKFYDGRSANNGKTLSHVGMVNGKKLIESIDGNMSFIFNENIRLFEGKNTINDKIYETATYSSADMFYFYNNGITFICSKVNRNMNNNVTTLCNASIVNGCQTVMSLKRAYDDKKLSDDVWILVRVIIEDDYDKRNKITRFLNTQNPIKSSYYFANESIIIDLQKQLFSKGWFLERQLNESNYREEFDGKKIDYSKIKIIKLADAIQYYVGYYIDDLSNIAKSGKSELFIDENKDKVLKSITADKVIFVYNRYLTIMEFIHKYRKFRRNNKNKDFADSMGIDFKNFKKSKDEYLFMNTADILLLNISKYFNNKKSNDIDCVIKTINAIKDFCIKNNSFDNQSVSTFTKSHASFQGIRNFI